MITIVHLRVLGPEGFDLLCDVRVADEDARTTGVYSRVTCRGCLRHLRDMGLIVKAEECEAA